MKGGSVASSAVEGLVQAPTWDKLDVQFDNQVGGKKQKKPAKKKNKEDKQTKQKNKKGGFCPICGGGMKHINDFDDEGLFNLYNKKGGAAAPSFEMKYDYSDALVKPPHGDAVQRGFNADVVGVSASESPSTLGSMSKAVQFGNVFDAPKVPFVYTGGSKKTSKTSKKTPQKKTGDKPKKASKKPSK